MIQTGLYSDHSVFGCLLMWSNEIQTWFDPWNRWCKQSSSILVWRSKSTRSRCDCRLSFQTSSSTPESTWVFLLGTKACSHSGPLCIGQPWSKSLHLLVLLKALIIFIRFIQVLLKACWELESTGCEGFFISFMRLHNCKPVQYLAKTGSNNLLNKLCCVRN